MPVRTAALPLLACVALGAFPAAALAQSQSTAADRAAEAAAQAGADVAMDAAQAAAPSVAPVFVSHPVVQPIGPAVSAAEPATPVVAEQAAAPAPAMAADGPAVPPVVYSGPGPVYYAMPGNAPAMTPHTPSSTQAAPPVMAAPYGYSIVPPGLPAGTQLVQFDREAWLAACRERLSGYDSDEQRSAAIAALGGAAYGYSSGRDHCETYLDSYVASAQAGTLAPVARYGQSYMLVPVTVLVPQAPRP